MTRREGVSLAPAWIRVHTGRLEGLRPKPVVLNSNDSSVAHSKDVEDLALQRLATDLVQRWAADTHHHPITGADELKGRHIAAKPEPLCNVSMTSSGPWQTHSS